MPRLKKQIRGAPPVDSTVDGHNRVRNALYCTIKLHKPKNKEQSCIPKKSMIWILLFLLTLKAVEASNVRNGTTGNCVGTRSCRPRCIGFRLNRAAAPSRCETKTGIFALSNRNDESIAWNLTATSILSCEACLTNTATSCEGMWQNDLFLELWEHASSTSFSTAISLAASDEQFTFCSINPCPKFECALPEQLRSQVEIIVHSQSSESVELAKIILSLTAPFEGDVLDMETSNRVGPLLVEWMDDPTNCRPGAFSELAPATPLTDPVIRGVKVHTPMGNIADLFCIGDEYEPASLPVAGPTSAPNPSPVQLQLVIRFSHVETYLHAMDIPVFETLSEDFLRSQGLDVQEFTLLRQALQDVPRFPRVSLLSEAGDLVFWPAPGDGSSSSAAAAPILILGVQLTVAAMDQEKLVPVLQTQWSSYIYMLSLRMEVFVSELQNTTIQHQSSDVAWMIAALLCSFAALLSVVMVRQNRDVRNQRQHGSRQENGSNGGSSRVHPEDPNIAIVSPSSPFVSDGTMTFPPPMLPNSSEHDAVSVESESGWKSHTGSSDNSSADGHGSGLARGKHYDSQPFAVATTPVAETSERRPVRGTLVYV